MAEILFINNYKRDEEFYEKKPMVGWKLSTLQSAIRKALIKEDEYSIVVLHEKHPNKITEQERFEDIERLKQVIFSTNVKLVVPMGEYALEALTGHESIFKWHLSPLRSKAEFGALKCLPILHPNDTLANASDLFYIFLGCQKAKEYLLAPPINPDERIMHYGLNFNDTIDFLNTALSSNALGLDIETGNSLINTMGIAINEKEAIAIYTLPEFDNDYASARNENEYFALWKKIAEVCESNIPKILQNFIYDCQFSSNYGIYVNNIHHDTMWAMKFLHPELAMGLDNIGRVYTNFPYWKDEGKSWNYVADWPTHFIYNCKDTTGMFAAYIRQKQELKERNLDALFYNYIMQFAEPIREMCTRGLLLDEDKLIYMKNEAYNKVSNLMTEIDTEFIERVGYKVNPRSGVQLKKALKQMGIDLPIKKDKKTDSVKETVDKKALIKLKKKYPKTNVFDRLIKLSAQNKQISSYLEFNYDQINKKVRYSLGGLATETGRWNSTLDPWGNGFNAQTIPKSIKHMFIAQPNHMLMEIDLAQAESRYVAYDCPEPRLIKMLNDGEDVHKFVASHIYNKPIGLITHLERQLGKKSGHAANYGVGPITFAESCLVEMDMVMTKGEAERIIATYYRIFPGILDRQRNIRDMLRRNRKLVTPIGRERYFYGRMDDNTFREGYAYAPQSTIPDIINHLMLKLHKQCNLLLQVHDSLLLEIPNENVNNIIKIANDLSYWHPKIKLAGGELWIPVEIKIGESWGNMDSV